MTVVSHENVHVLNYLMLILTFLSYPLSSGSLLTKLRSISMDSSNLESLRPYSGEGLRILAGEFLRPRGDEVEGGSGFSNLDSAFLLKLSRDSRESTRTSRVLGNSDRSSRESLDLSLGNISEGSSRDSLSLGISEGSGLKSRDLSLGGSEGSIGSSFTRTESQLPLPGSLPGIRFSFEDGRSLSLSLSLESRIESLSL